jgi:alkaline phosphatase
MGYNQFWAAGLYERGYLNSQPYAAFPVAHAVSTYPEGGEYDPAKTWTDFDYPLQGATDSAAAATALFTGHKTTNGRLGVDSQGNVLPNLLEQAESVGKASGVVTTVPFNHATPAGFVVHSESRHAYEEIARQMLLESAADLIMGAGHPLWDDAGQLREEPQPQSVGGAEVWAQLQSETGLLGADADGDGTRDAWTLVDTLAGFRELAQGETPARVFGLAPAASTLQERRPGPVGIWAAARLPHVPTLAEMTQAALNVLDEDPDGFVLMIEGGAVDWACHENRLDRLLEEMEDFDAAAAAVIKWVEQESSWEETLVVVTADHETGYLWGPDARDLRTRPLGQGVGQVVRAQFYCGGHSNMVVPLFARGPGAESFREYRAGSDNWFGDYIDNTAVGLLARRLLGAPAADPGAVQSDEGGE